MLAWRGVAVRVCGHPHSMPTGAHCSHSSEWPRPGPGPGGTRKAAKATKAKATNSGRQPRPLPPSFQQLCGDKKLTLGLYEVLLAKVVKTRIVVNDD